MNGFPLYRNVPTDQFYGKRLAEYRGVRLIGVARELLLSAQASSGVHGEELITFLYKLIFFDKPDLHTVLPVLCELLDAAEEKARSDWRYEKVAGCLYAHIMHVEVFLSRGGCEFFPQDGPSAPSYDFRISLEGLRNVRRWTATIGTPIGSFTTETPQDVFNRTAKFLTLANGNGTAFHVSDDIYETIREGRVLFSSAMMRNSSAHAGIKAKIVRSCACSPPLRTIRSVLTTLQYIAMACGDRMKVSVSLHQLLWNDRDESPSVNDVPLNTALEMMRCILNIPRNAARNVKIMFSLPAWHIGLGSMLNRPMDMLKMSLTIPDLFFERVERDEHWSLLSPQGGILRLSHLKSGEFSRSYKTWEGVIGHKTQRVRANELLRKIAVAVLEGKISTLRFGEEGFATEGVNIYEQSASVNVSALVHDSEISSLFVLEPLFKRVEGFVKLLVSSLNVAIEKTEYLREEDRIAAWGYRDIGVGICGLGTLLQRMNVPYEYGCSIVEDLMRTVKFAALRQSCDEAKIVGRFSGFHDSAYHQVYRQGELIWTHTRESSRYHDDPYWTSGEGQALRRDMYEYGLANRKLISLPRMGKSSAVADCSAALEPVVSRGRAINSTLRRLMAEKNMASSANVENVLRAGGSIQNMEIFTDREKEVFKLPHEISSEVYFEMYERAQNYTDYDVPHTLYLAGANINAIMECITRAHAANLKCLRIVNAINF